MNHALDACAGPEKNFPRKPAAFRDQCFVHHPHHSKFYDLFYYHH
jgi:hypothetical protein